MNKSDFLKSIGMTPIAEKKKRIDKEQYKDTREGLLLEVSRNLNGAINALLYTMTKTTDADKIEMYKFGAKTLDKFGEHLNVNMGMKWND